MTDRPLSTECSNDHREDYWTCPGCYNDLGDVGEGDAICPKCNRTVSCTLEYIPSCRSRLEEDD